MEPQEMADKLVKDNIAKAIADRMMQILRYKAEIKKLEKQIEQIKKGERVPGDNKSSEKPKPCHLPPPLPVTPYKPWIPPHNPFPPIKYRWQ